MLTRRLIACLDVKNGRVVKGTKFVGLRDVGDPVELATRCEREGADEIVFLDITAAVESRGTLRELVQRTAEHLFIPLTVGGGVRTVQDVGDVLRAGADKVSVNTAAVERPGLITDCADRFGAQCVVASIDAKREGDSWRVVVKGGREATTLDVVEWAKRCAELGAGEIMLTSIDQDGARTGYDLVLTRAVREAVSIPVIASGGAGSAEHVCAALEEGQADAALVAGILHDEVTTVRALKEAMISRGIPTRRVA